MTPKVRNPPSPAQLQAQYLRAWRLAKYARTYRAAVQLLVPAAAHGHAPSMYALGHMIRYGRGVRRDLGRGFEWMMKAARAGDPRAQYSLGVCYTFGEGRRRNRKQALKWFLAAASKREPAALYNCGLYYEYGFTGKPQPKIAAHFYRRATKGDPTSLYHLGVCHLDGIGTEQDTPAALRWLSLAAQKGHASARTKLKELVTAFVHQVCLQPHPPQYRRTN